MQGTEVGAVKKCSQKYVFNLLIRVEVGSKMSMISITFHIQGTLLKKEMMCC